MLLPSMSAAFKPDNYRNLELFADRAGERKLLAAMVESYLVQEADGEATILVNGPRGVGKSILVRQVLEDVTPKYGPLVVTVDAAGGAYGAHNVLRRLRCAQRAAAPHKRPGRAGFGARDIRAHSSPERDAAAFGRDDEGQGGRGEELE